MAGIVLFEFLATFRAIRNFVATGAGNSSNFPASASPAQLIGPYTTSITEEDAGNTPGFVELIGQWQINFDYNSRFTISQNGTIKTDGYYSYNNEELSLAGEQDELVAVGEKGSYSCNYPTTHFGVYNWKNTLNGLELT